MRNNLVRPRAGFTAIEMVVVLTVLMVLVGLSVPALVGALRKGSVSDAANSIVRVASQARQFARSRSVGTDSADPYKFCYYGMIIAVPDTGPAYAAVTFGNSSPPTVADILPRRQIAGEKPVAMMLFNRNVLVYVGATNPQKKPDDATPLAAGQSIGWLYQYRTGYPIAPPASTAPDKWSTVSPINIGVDPVPATGITDDPLKSVDPATIAAKYPDKISGQPLRQLSLRTVDGKYRTAVALYEIGLSNVQDF